MRQRRVMAYWLVITYKLCETPLGKTHMQSDLKTFSQGKAEEVSISFFGLCHFTYGGRF